MFVPSFFCSNQVPNAQQRLRPLAAPSRSGGAASARCSCAEPCCAPRRPPRAGDVNSVTIGEKTNVQDNALIHVARHNPAGQALPTRIGSGVTIGPGATIHAAVIEDCVVVGMGATVMDGAKVGAPSGVPLALQLPPRNSASGRGGKSRFLSQGLGWAREGQGGPMQTAGAALQSQPGAGRVECLPAACGFVSQALRPSCAVLPGHLQVESRSVVAAGALVTPGTVIPSGQVWAGSPAKFLRNLMEGE